MTRWSWACRRTTPFLLIGLFAAVLPLFRPPAALAQAALHFDPAGLELTARLGEQLTSTVSLVNSGDVSADVQLLEAKPSLSSTTRRAITAPLRVAIPTVAQRLDPHLQLAFRAAPNVRRDFIVYLDSQADLSVAAQTEDWAERGRVVYHVLTNHASASQRGITQQLAARGLSYRSLWIVNAVLVHGTLADAQALAGRADVAAVRDNYLQSVQTTSAAPSSCSSDSNSTLCWNIQAVGADRVWRDFGITGQGIVLANLDTGVDVTHPALSARYRGNRNSDTTSNDYNWYDPQGATPGPVDMNGHGTHTMGTAVGAGTTNIQPAIGVAPGTTWIAAQGCDASICSDSDLISGAQWLLAPTRSDGSEPRPDLRPMIINNSWSADNDDQWFAPYTTAWRAAGIFPVFAAGNARSDHPQTCGSILSPGNYADVTAVGALRRDNTIASFSLLGPSADGRMKPDLAAPGAEIFSAAPLSMGAYQTLSGTSMAAPHVAGAVALMWSANPTLIGDYDATYAILRDTATRLPDNRCGMNDDLSNNVFGYGKLNVYAAVERARVDIPWLDLSQTTAHVDANSQTTVSITLDAGRLPGPGDYQARVLATVDGEITTLPVRFHVTDAEAQTAVAGEVTSSVTGEGVPATIQVQRSGSSAGLEISTDETGHFQLMLPLDTTYTLRARANAYLPATTTFTVAAGLVLSISLDDDLPHLVAPTEPLTASIDFGQVLQQSIPIANHGVRPLYYQVAVANDRFRMRRSDASDLNYSWIDLPADAKTLKLAAGGLVDNVPMGIEFPFYGYVVTDVVVLADGQVTIDRPFTYLGPSSTCLPDEWAPFYLIAPLRMDLDPSAGGQVRYGKAGDNRFVVSYEQIPLRNGPAEQTYSFQVILSADGQIVYQYKDVDMLPRMASAGIQRSPFDMQLIGCGPSMPITNELAIAFEPQLATSDWLNTSSTGGVLQPGEQTEIPIRVAWVRPRTPGQAFEGRVVISSNDSRQMRYMVPVQLFPTAAPYEQWILWVERRS